MGLKINCGTPLRCEYLRNSHIIWYHIKPWAGSQMLASQSRLDHLVGAFNFITVMSHTWSNIWVLMYSLGVSSSSLSHGGTPTVIIQFRLGFCRLIWLRVTWRNGNWLRGSDGQAALCVKYGINNQCHEFQFFVGKAQWKLLNGLMFDTLSKIILNTPKLVPNVCKSHI